MSDSERVKRNVDDVPYVTSAEMDMRPMREVLRERHKLEIGAGTRLQREAAYRERAGMIGMLQSCICLYPLTKYPTESDHAEWCVSHGLFLSIKAAAARSGRTGVDSSEHEASSDQDRDDAAADPARDAAQEESEGALDP